MQVLILASESRYRRELLARLGLGFETMAPAIDESPLPDETPEQLVVRLARAKAQAIRQQLDALTVPPTYPPIIIASDQTGGESNRLLHKPGTRDQARTQLRQISGRQVTFYTGIHLFHLGNGRRYEAIDRTVCQLRDLDEQEIERYVQQDDPLDCAGSFKVESLGISLFEKVESQDPTGLIGLPLIELCRGLRQLGLSIP